MFINRQNISLQRLVRPRHICVVLLFIYIILEALVLATCTTPAVSNYYLLSLTYLETQENSPISELRLRLGYFSSCVSVNGGSYSCGVNAYDMLLASSEFDSSNASCVDLYNLVIETADMFRSRCMTPYILLISVIMSFLILTMMAFISPRNYRNAYKPVFFVCYVSLSLSVIASVWQESNINTANMLFQQVLDNYYTVQAHYGDYTRGAIWAGTGIQILISLSSLMLAIMSSWTDRFVNAWDYYNTPMGSQMGPI
ncbi:hypothetical protein DASC09_001100 [Saccharomycopsis crataegensis]|uniref:Uncharacterized protein n=1 Tax=Saccharomycopsis crataegensis TaxID=43959 RepID=A0AAV5QCX1_9ASCO|nr:hypothetical protein DASC09_001100 [Saccharomycopsis crataegensis]